MGKLEEPRNKKQETKQQEPKQQEPRTKNAKNKKRIRLMTFAQFGAAMQTPDDRPPADGKVFDLEERTYLFPKAVRAFVRRLPTTISNIEDIKQVVRSSGSVGANYIEANEGLGTKDFKMRVRISRKESKETKETAYWLRLIFTGDRPDLDAERNRLIAEANELKLIFSAIIRKAGG